MIKAHAKINLALVVGAIRPDGFHELASVVQRIDLADELDLRIGPGLVVDGFDDTLVRRALTRLARAARTEPHWHVRIDKRIPVAAGLGGGSSDAAATLVAANATLPRPLAPERLLAVAADVGADVPFFLDPGPKLVEGAGERLTRLELPQDYTVVLAVPNDRTKSSTGDVFRRFDELDGPAGFAARRDALGAALDASDLAALPPNDLARAAGGSPLAADLLDAGAFRADLSGAGPAVYGLFATREQAEIAAVALEPAAQVWISKPVW
jgi:4-diphosphocytidyl-2-C-methyl-D-erythritol kinase